MQLGISSYTYGWAVGTDQHRPANALSAIDLIDRAAALGVHVLQICDNLPAQTYEPASVAAIARHAEQKRVSIEVGTRGCDAGHLRRFFNIARTLRSPVLRVVLDTADDQPTETEVIDRLTTILPDFAAGGLTVCLAIENHDRLRSAALVRILRELDRRGLGALVGICLDTVNSFGALEGPEVVVDRLGPYVVNLHLKDFAVRRLPHLQGFTIEGRPAGEGMLDIPWLLGRLRELNGNDYSAILELWTPPEADEAATIRKEADWAERSVRAARAWLNE
jgi:3-oxoisoapionate decarboxylase